MKLWSTILIPLALLVIGGTVMTAQYRHHVQQRREWVAITTEVRAAKEELARSQAALAELERHNSELAQAERRAGNATLLSLMRERAATTQTLLDAELRARGVVGAIALLSGNPEQRSLDRERIRNAVKANSLPFVKRRQLSPEKANEYIEVVTEYSCRQADLVAALLNEKIPFQEALRQRDANKQETDALLREILGDKVFDDLMSDSSKQRAEQAGMIIKEIQDNLGENKLTPEQSDRLQKLIKDELVNLQYDEIDYFRPLDEVQKAYDARQQAILAEMAPLVTPAQMEALKKEAADSLKGVERSWKNSRQALKIR